MAVEPRQKPDFEENLGFGSYVLKSAWEAVVLTVSPIVGLVGGLGVDKLLFSKTKPIIDAKRWEEGLGDLTKVPGLKTPFSSKAPWLMGLGALGTSIMGALILGYGKWKKEKQAQIQVDEILKDISDIEVFKKTDPELKAENDRLQKLLKEREAKHGEHKTWQDKVAHKPDAPTAHPHVG